LKNGIVVKAYSSYYYVQSDNKVVMCTVRGRFKKERFSLLVGDHVEYTATGEEKGVIEQILPRRTMLQRPMVANVDQVVVTFAAVNPDMNIALVDKFLVVAESSGLDVVICINKMDLADSQEMAAVEALYRNIGYQVVLTSVRAGTGVEEVRNLLFNRITVFAGPSGAGKSSLLNALQPGLLLVTGEVSHKIGRGKHTTRFAELLSLAGGGFVVDTPGFSLTDFIHIPEAQLAYCFPEISREAPKCRFSTCLHNKEPQCSVKQAVVDGLIARSRYESYLTVLSEIHAGKKGF